MMLRRLPIRPARAARVLSLRRNIGIASTIQACTETVQHVHQLSGIPWYLFIPLSTFTLRSVLTLPLAILNRRRLQKQNRLRPLINAMRPVVRFRLAAQQQAQQQGKITSILPKENLSYEKIMLLSTKEIRKRQKKLFSERGIQIWKNFVLPVTQIPLWVTMSLTFRNLTGWKTDFVTAGNARVLDPTLTTEGIPYYLTDLSLPDPYSVLPLTLGLLALSNVEWNNKTIQLMNLTNRGKKISYRPTIFDSMINLSRYSIIFLIVMSIQAPSALSLYWISSNFFSLGQNVLMDKYLPLNYTPYATGNFQKASKNAKPLIKGI